MRFNVTLTQRELTLVRVACMQRLNHMKGNEALADSYRDTYNLIDTTLHLSEVGNVKDYFESKLGTSLNDPSFLNLPLRSQCGNDCRFVIDTAKALLDAAREEMKQSEVDTIVNSVAHVIAVFWHG